MGRRLFDVVAPPPYQTTGQVLQDLTLFDPVFVKAIDVLARQALARHTSGTVLPPLRGKYLKPKPAIVRLKSSRAESA